MSFEIGECDGEFKHCDDYIDEYSTPAPLRAFLFINRLPAAYKHLLISTGYIKENTPQLFADFEGKRVQVVMASRLGDLGITVDLSRGARYNTRVPVAFLSNFSNSK